MLKLSSNGLKVQFVIFKSNSRPVIILRSTRTLVWFRLLPCNDFGWFICPVSGFYFPYFWSGNESSPPQLKHSFSTLLLFFKAHFYSSVFVWQWREGFMGINSTQWQAVMHNKILTAYITAYLWCVKQTSGKRRLVEVGRRVQLRTRKCHGKILWSFFRGFHQVF